MKRAVSTAVSIVAAIAIAGCSDSTASPTGGNNTAALASTSAKPSQPPASTTESGILKKQVGESASLGGKCSTKDSPDCMIRFIVTDISWTDADCSSPATAGNAYLHLSIDVSSAPDLETDTGLDSALVYDNWGITDPDGYSAKPVTAAQCSYDAGPFYAALLPGTKQKGDIVFEAPVGSTSLYLAPSVIQGRWEWSIPAQS